MLIQAMRNTFMTSAKAHNWVNDLTFKQQEECYNEIVNYFIDEVVHEVLLKYDKSLDFNHQKV